MHSSLIATDSSKSGTPKWVYCLAIGPATFLALLAAGQSWVPAWQLFVDPIRVAEVAGPDCCHVYYGFISNMGILLWCTTAACCLFAALLTLSRKVRPIERGYLLSTAFLSGLLLFDDFLMFHERLIPHHTNISQNSILAFYFVCIVAYLVTFREILMRADVALLTVCLGLFGVSIGIDIISDLVGLDIFDGGTGTYFLAAEDSAKFIGIASWTTYHVRAAWRLLASSQAAPVVE